MKDRNLQAAPPPPLPKGMKLAQDAPETVKARVMERENAPQGNDVTQSGTTNTGNSLGGGTVLGSTNTFGGRNTPGGSNTLGGDTEPKKISERIGTKIGTTLGNFDYEGAGKKIKSAAGAAASFAGEKAQVIKGKVQEKMAAPTPPPAPTGFTAAPTPPPVPTGFTAAPAAEVPTPPPVPTGFTAAPAAEVPTPPPAPTGFTAAPAAEVPTPPPAPTGFTAAAAGVAAATVASEGPGLGNVRGSGRAISLTQAEEQRKAEEEAKRIAEEKAREEEARRKAEEEARKRKVHALGGDLDVDDMCYARSHSDGLYYYAKVVSFTENEATLEFFDGVEEKLPHNKIHTVKQSIQMMQPFANWNGRGNYFPCRIDKTNADTVNVTYDENPSMKEEVTYANVRFAIR